MISAIASLLVALSIAFGRQTAVFGKVKKSLWFFSNYEKKRWLFSIVSISLSIYALYYYPEDNTIFYISLTSWFLLLLSFLFDFKYIFPEIDTIEKEIGNALLINDNEEIIGVYYKEQAIAYPLNVLIPRHIINDKIGDENIVISYCAICRSALAFSAKIGIRNFYFKVSAVWRRNMVMIDNQTKSLWQQATGECIYGNYKGYHLTLISGENTNWKAWKKKHPNSLYAHKTTEARKGYFSKEWMLKALYFITPKITPPGFSNLSELPTRETVFGIKFNGISKAYPKSEFKTSIVFTDKYRGRIVHLSYDLESDYLTATNLANKQQIIVEKHWWLGWKEFHPDTLIWKNDL